VKELVKCEECNDRGIIAVQQAEGGIEIEPCIPCNMEDYVEYIESLVDRDLHHDFFRKHGIDEEGVE
jgi:hypothetical protein